MIKRATTFFIIACFSLNAYPQENFSSYTVPGKVPVLQQNKTMDCWITVITMMMGWRDATTYTTDEVAAILGDPWLIYYTTNTGLPAADQSKFMMKTHLKCEPPANYMLSAYVDLLQKHGPLWIITGTISGAHARLLTGIEGNGNYEQTDFIFVDPDKGKVIRENAIKFFKKFEAEAKIANEENWEDLRIQIYHF